MNRNGNARWCAAITLYRFERGDDLFRTLYQESVNLSPRNRRLARKLVTGVLQNRTLLDFRIDELLVSSGRNIPPVIRNIMRIALYQILFLNGIPEWAAVSEAVESAGIAGASGMKRLVNGVLRNFLRSGTDKDSPVYGVPGESIKSLAIKYSHPEWLLERWVKQFGFRTAERIASVDNETPGITFQVNRMKTSTTEVLKSLVASGVSVEEAEPDGLGIRTKGIKDLDSLEVFSEGSVYVQDESAAAVASMLPSDPDFDVLDLCSAPGGKALTMAVSRQDKGSIVAADISPERLRLLGENLSRLGLKSINPVVFDGLKPALKKYFNLVLVDAPCTGTGTLRKRTDLRWRLKPSMLKELPHFQISLLEKAAELTHNGGYLVYSTCSLEEEENVEVVNRFLKEHPDFHIGEFDSVPGNPETFDKGMVLYLPVSSAGDGAFAAIMKRK